MKINAKYLIKISARFVLAATLLAGTGCGRETAGDKSAAETPANIQLYTCGMHPNVIQEEPGNCPICGMDLVPMGQPAAAVSATDAGGERKIIYYRAPMDPTYISPQPGKSPMGMDLVPVYEGEEAFGATVRINPVVQQNMGVRIAPVVRRNMFQTIRTIGRIDYDEARVAHIHTKFSGWIEKTFVNTTGQKVSKAQSLLEIYSPQLVTAQEEFIDAFNNFQGLRADASTVVRTNQERILASARRRLEYFDVSRDQIERLIATGEVTKTMQLKSPFKGIVTRKYALDGMEVKSGMNLYTIADLSEIWVYADIYEYEVPWVAEGQKAVMTLSYDPGKTYTGAVQYIYPYLEEKTRTIKVRLVFDNPNLELKPGMYANVEIETSPLTDVVAVPMEAILFSGERNLVIVSLGEGRFAPRDVTIGVEGGDGYYQVLEGLSAGEEIVLSGQFLIDSESKLQESIAKMLQLKSSAAAPEPAPEEQHNHSMPEMHGASTGVVPFGVVADGRLTYYTCPMESHSYVRMPGPGKCPECGMTLERVAEAFDENIDYYTCPMAEHAHVIMEAPGECPLCNMNLVPVEI
ncbi:MAG: efflux RND transporter periplasmic adaptor subunit [Candidatus Neomarinimicrobiota bacterium]